MSIDENRLSGVPGLFAALTVLPLVLGGWALLLSVIPLEMARAGASTLVAGLSTAIFMAAAVITQFMTPRILRAYGYRPVIAVGAILLGAPAVGMLVTSHFGWWNAIAIVRGIGFGLLTVACTSLPARIAPNRMLGRVAAAQGIGMSLLQAVGLGGGLLINDAFGFAAVIAIGTVLPVLGCVVLLRVPPTAECAVERGLSPKLGGHQWRRAAEIMQLALIAAAFGGLTVLVPITEGAQGVSAVVVLTLVSVFAMAGRLVAGRAHDAGHSRVLRPMAFAVAAATLIVFALPAGTFQSAIPDYAAAAAFGFCFGIVQNDTVVALYGLFADSGKATASKWWNIGIDTGIGVGSFAFGAIAALSGPGFTYISVALAVALGLPICLSGGTRSR